CTPYFAYW
nr:immunoglobulin heavy chain junction region [Mus musculus]